MFSPTLTTDLFVNVSPNDPYGRSLVQETAISHVSRASNKMDDPVINLSGKRKKILFFLNPASNLQFIFIIAIQ